VVRSAEVLVAGEKTGRVHSLPFEEPSDIGKVGRLPRVIGHWIDGLMVTRSESGVVLLLILSSSVPQQSW
jgi:hypothetical protein